MPSRWARGFTIERWNLNPFQMWSLAMLMSFSLAQLIFGPSRQSIQATELDHRTTQALALANLLGGLIAMYGLHVKNTDTSVLLEFWGYVSLIGTMGVYAGILIVTRDFPNTTYALGMAEAFVLGSLHRSLILMGYRRARRRRDKLAQKLDDIESRD